MCNSILYIFILLFLFSFDSLKHLTVKQTVSLVKWGDLPQKRFSSSSCLKVNVCQHCSIVLKPVKCLILTLTILTSL